MPVAVPSQEKVKEEPRDESSEQNVDMANLKPVDESFKKSAHGVHESVLNKAPKALPAEEAVEFDEAHTMESHIVKKEPDDEINDYVKNKTKVAKSDEFSVPPIVKVEHGQGVEVTNYSTWTQDNYLDYYGYADEETGLFPFKPGEVDRQVDVHFTKPQEISELFDMTKQIVKEEPDATYPDEAFHKFPNQIMSHS